MLRISGFPISSNECKNIEITFLKKNGYLALHTSLSGTIQWSRNVCNIDSVSIVSYIFEEKPYIKLSYIYKQIEEVKYKIYVSSKPSN